MRTILTGARLFTGESIVEDHALVIEQDRIEGLVAARLRPRGDHVVTLPRDTLLAPGFIDIQVNGGGGILFNDQPTAQGALGIARAHRRYGTTAILPTVITDAPEVLFAAAEGALQAMQERDGGIVGLHVEGPFLNPERKGAHPPAFIRRPDDALIARFAALAGRFGAEARVLLTLAPEQVQDSDIEILAAAGVIVCAGHSAASFERTRAAIAAGVRGITHLFNAMPSIDNRAPGIAAAALSSAGTTCGIIADGIHVHPALLRLALRCKAPGEIVLVTDAMPPTGTDIDGFLLQGRRIRRAGGRLELEDGTLAGADIDMAQAVRNAVSMLEVPVEEALRMASLYPARFLGLDATRGRLDTGCRADLVALDGDLAVRDVWVGGIQVGGIQVGGTAGR